MEKYRVYIWREESGYFIISAKNKKDAEKIGRELYDQERRFDIQHGDDYVMTEMTEKIEDDGEKADNEKIEGVDFCYHYNRSHEGVCVACDDQLPSR
jgi:hypothetical protein